MTPGPFDPPTLKAIYFISPGEVDLTPEKVKSWLRSVNQYSVRNISVHEVYPGHYLNMLHLKGSATTARKLAHSYAFTEGWAHYTEELYAEHVYGDASPRYRLAQIQDALLRVCRYMTSIGLHTQGWSIEEGTKYFMENALCRGSLGALAGHPRHFRPRLPPLHPGQALHQADAGGLSKKDGRKLHTERFPRCPSPVRQPAAADGPRAVARCELKWQGRGLSGRDLPSYARQGTVFNRAEKMPKTLLFAPSGAEGSRSDKEKFS